MSTHLRVGQLNVGIIPNRRECRITLRVWRQRGERRTGGMVAIGLRPKGSRRTIAFCLRRERAALGTGRPLVGQLGPLSVRAGRDVPAELLP